MSRSELVRFIRRHRWGVVATTAPDGAPSSAVVGVAVTDGLELVFDTLGGTRKAQNLRRDPRIAVVIGWDEEQTVQYQGVADEPAGVALDRARDCYFAQFPDGTSRLAWPGITYFRICPTWIRFSDFRTRAASAEPTIVERAGAAWLALD